VASEALYQICPSCNATARKKQPTCLQCGHKFSKTRKPLLWIFVALAVIATAALLVPSQQPKTETNALLPASEPSDKSLERIPEEQQKLVAVLSEFQKLASEAKNDLQLAQLRDRRKNAIRALSANLKVKDWTGRVQTLTTNSDGLGVLVVELAPNILIGTWNNAFSDVVENTLIPKSTPLYERISMLKVGDGIKFSGNFFVSEEDEIREKSLTMRGSLAEPEFLFKFSDQ
jgi:hypothetical protein